MESIESVRAAVLAHPDIESARLFPSRASGEWILVLVVPRLFTTAAAVRAFVQDSVPELEPPVVAVVGSVDAGLRRPTLEELAAQGAEVSVFCAPRSAVERELCGLWRDVLGTAGIGVRDHFLDIGGESLVAVELATAIEDMFGVTLELEEIFDRGTVEELARRIEELSHRS